MNFFFWGLLSLFQTLFLPGLLLLGFFRMERFPFALLLAPLSLLFNYILVFTLTILGTYTRSTLLFFIVAEIVALVVLILKSEKQRSYFWALPLTAVRDRTRNIISDHYNHFFFWIAICFTFWFVFLLAGRVPNHFNFYDDTFNWNRWAMDWYLGILPRDTFEYPQLVPISWSVTYKMIQSTDIEYFATFSNGIVALNIVALFWGAWAVEKHVALLWGPILCSIFLYLTFGPHLGRGTADVHSVLYISCCLFLAYLVEINRFSLKYFRIFGTAMMIGAATSKQAGALFVIPFLVLLFHFEKRVQLKQAGGRNLRQIAGRFVMPMLSYALLVAPWYVYKKYQIIHGLDRSITRHIVIELCQGKSFWQRIAATPGQFLEFFPDVMPFEMRVIFASIGFLGGAWLSYLALRIPLGRICLLVGLVPYVIAYALFFGCEGLARRYLGYAIPFAIFPLILGAQEVCNLKMWKKPRVFPLAPWAVLIILLIYTCNQVITFDVALAEKRKFIAGIDPAFIMLDQFRVEHGFEGKIITNRGCPQCNLNPGMESYFTYPPFQWKFFEEEMAKPENRYVLVLFYSSQADPDGVRDRMRALAKEGKIKLIQSQSYSKGQDQGCDFYELRR